MLPTLRVPMLPNYKSIEYVPILPNGELLSTLINISFCSALTCQDAAQLETKVWKRKSETHGKTTEKEMKRGVKMVLREGLSIRETAKVLDISKKCIHNADNCYIQYLAIY